MLATLRLAASLLKRELRSGDWYILFFALLLSTAAVTSLDFYTSRIMSGVNAQSNRLLGGDMAVISPRPIPVEWKQTAHESGLKYAEVWSYPSVARAGSGFQLVNVQAVSQTYPLLNETSLRPDAGTIWVEPRLLPLFNINQGDSLTIGRKQFIIKRELTPDIDMLNTGLVMAPRVMMRLDDVAATGTVLPGSRVEYRLLLTGSASSLTDYRQWLSDKLVPGQRILTIRDQESFVRNTLERIENYLQLIMLVCLVMSSVAIMLSIHQYMRRHYSHVALWRCLGMPKRQLITLLFCQLLFIAFAAGLAGTLTGYIVQTTISQLFSNLLPYPIAAAGWQPIIKGFITSLLLLFAFAYPLLSHLPDTPPLYLWRKETEKISVATPLYWLSLCGGLGLLLYSITNISLLTIFFIDIILFSIALLYLINIILLSLTRKLINITNGPVKRGLSHLVQHPDSSGLQFSGFTLILICLFILAATRTTLIQQWQQNLPANTPNYFIINIAPDDIAGIKENAKQHNVEIADIYPMVRGRLSKLNNTPIMGAIPVEARDHNALHRELNLSWMDTYPSDNQIVAGQHWSESAKGMPIASVEESLANKLYLKLGDELSFQVGEREVSAKIVNFRRVDWTSFHPNFYVIFPPGLLDGMPVTYITSFHLTKSSSNFLNHLIQQFPNITIIDVASLLGQIQGLVDKVSIAVQYLFLFSLGAGVLIIIVSFQSGLDERRQTWHLLRILGASRRYISTSIMVEFTYLFLLIIVTSAGLAEIFMYFIKSLI